MNQKIVVALIVLGAAMLWARSAFAKSATESTHGIERDSRLNVSRVTGAAHESVPENRFRPLAFEGTATRNIKSSAIQSPLRLTAFGNVRSAEAAYLAPIFVQDAPSSRATVF